MFMKTYECKIKDESSLIFLRKLNASFGSWVRKLFVKLYDHPVDDKKGLPKKVRQLYLQVSLEEVTPPIETRAAVGGIGVDLNCDHLAIGETDRYGNPIQAFNLPIKMENKTSEQITAMLGNHIKDIVAYAKLKNKPISIEKLDFQKKKSALREIHGPKMARMLSSFAYDKFMSMMASRCAREGVKLHMVNPAFSSVLGAYNYFGLSHLYTSHQMASFILARRGLGFNDSLKCIYNERSLSALQQTVSIAPEKAPPTFEAWIKSRGKRHRWSLLRRYYVSFSLFVKHLGSKNTKACLRHPQAQRRIFPSSPPELQLSLA
jgi:IS605 OrfB family transposase